MPRSRNIYSVDFPYHVTARTNDKEPFSCHLDEAWRVYSNALHFYSRACDVRILGFVMMKNHFHLLLRTPQGNLSDFMKLFMKRTSDDIREITGASNHLYGGRYYPSLITHEKYYRTVYKYVLQNPLRAGLCQRVLDYPYSTLRGLLGLEHTLIPTVDEFGLLNNIESTLVWLNMQLDPEKSDQIAKGLRVQQFKPGHNRARYLDRSLYFG